MKLIHPLSIEYGMNRKVFPQILIHYRESLLLCGLAIVVALYSSMGDNVYHASFLSEPYGANQNDIGFF